MVKGEVFFRLLEPEARIPGGCDDCLAYRTLDSSEAPMYRLVVHHDASCPFLRVQRGTDA